LADSEGEAMPEIPPEAPAPEMQPTLAAPSAGSAVIDALSTASMTSSFSINNIPTKGVSIANLPPGAGMDAKGIGEKIGKSGMGRIGGTSMIRFFGKMAEVQ